MLLFCLVMSVLYLAVVLYSRSQVLINCTINSLGAWSFHCNHCGMLKEVLKSEILSEFLSIISNVVSPTPALVEKLTETIPSTRSKLIIS